uniref:Leucine-rich repeat protein (LRRP) n=1 Tax=Trypanosoma congolense (strain IL3000) TaxID=1068625 RepID=G0UKU0_TRYCI|nr:conserved hypothetical protein [Trypanosoma congolense IL3000]
MTVTPYDDIVDIGRRCSKLREALGKASDDVRADPSSKYLYMCEVSGERPNPVFLAVTRNKNIRSLDLHNTYLGHRALLPILLTLSLCTWIEYINLQEERLTTTLIELLCEALAGLPRISVIDVSGNPFGSFGVEALLKLVRRRESIVECHVNGVQCVGALSRRLQAACERNARGFHKCEGTEDPRCPVVRNV